jgi:hypothetical protein
MEGWLFILMGICGVVTRKRLAAGTARWHNRLGLGFGVQTERRFGVAYAAVGWVFVIAGVLMLSGRVE